MSISCCLAWLDFTISIKYSSLESFKTFKICVSVSIFLRTALLFLSLLKNPWQWKHQLFARLNLVLSEQSALYYVCSFLTGHKILLYSEFYTIPQRRDWNKDRSLHSGYYPRSIFQAVGTGNRTRSNWSVFRDVFLVVNQRLLPLRITISNKTIRSNRKKKRNKI